MEEQKLELRLGPPGDNQYNSSCGTKKGLLLSSLDHEGKAGERNWLPNSSNSAVNINTVVPNCSDKRMGMATVVGWPPVRSFRKNLAAASSSKAAAAAAGNKGSLTETREGKVENIENSLFVKINMDGIPIGRKIDLKAYHDYQTLSSAVDQLFRSLLAAQMNPPGNLEEEGKAITGLLEGRGEYTLVYEDHEGDRMLVGDVPWNMFVSTAKRLRVLKTSELSSLQGKGTI
ncbi:hypothetical protein NMG60_11027854 [Bertholletia excelsa]